MNKFKVGDIITGTRESKRYSITTAGALMKVTKVYKDNYINVKVIDQRIELLSENIGRIFPVDSAYFKKITKIERILKFDK